MAFRTSFAALFDRQFLIFLNKYSLCETFLCVMLSCCFSVSLLSNVKPRYLYVCRGCFIKNRKKFTRS